MQNRLRSKAAWAGVLALVGFILGNWGLYDKIGLTSESWQTLANLVLAAVGGFAVWNDPTNPTGF